MKKLSETYKKLGIAFTFPIEIKDAKGNMTYRERSGGYCYRREWDAANNETYYEDSEGYWRKWEYDADGNVTYFEDSEGFWDKTEYDSNGKETYYESSDGYWLKREYDSDGKETYRETSDGDNKGTPRSQSCERTDKEILKKAYEDIIWMAIRYAHGRQTYAPSMVRDSIKEFQQVFPDWRPRHDITLRSDRERMEEHYTKQGKDASQLKTDWLDDLVQDNK